MFKIGFLLDHSNGKELSVSMFALCRPWCLADVFFRIIAHLQVAALLLNTSENAKMLDLSHVVHLALQVQQRQLTIHRMQLLLLSAVLNPPSHWPNHRDTNG